MGEVLLDSLSTKQTELLGTKEVAKLVKRDQLDDAFLMLINEDTYIQEVLSSDDPILANIPGSIIPELKLKVILDQHRDLFRSTLPDVNMLSNTRLVTTSTRGTCTIQTNVQVFTSRAGRNDKSSQ
jgi:hypothetical protein